MVLPAVSSWKNFRSSGILQGSRFLRPMTRFSAQATMRFIIFGILPDHGANGPAFQAPGCRRARPLPLVTPGGQSHDPGHDNRSPKGDKDRRDEGIDDA